MELTRFDDYWGGKAPWKNVTIREIPNDSARMSALLAGDVDFVNQVQPADVGMLEKRKGIKVFSGPSAFNFLLFTDMRKTSPKVTDKAGKPLDTNPFLKPEVRQAISESIDRQLLVDRLMDGQGSVATQAVPEGIIGYNPSIPKPVYDPAHAKELLAKAGYPDGFGVELTCTSDRLPNDGRICEGLGQFLTRIGIAVKVNAIPRSVFFSKRAAGDFSLFMHGWGTVTGETSQVLEPLLHTNDRAAGAGSWNVYGYSNPKMDADVDGANQQIDPAKRKAMLEDAMKLVVSDRAMIPLVNINTITAARSDKISDFTPRLDEDT
jgi:peptide/nickel transport system substrate-binding protein